MLDRGGRCPGSRRSFGLPSRRTEVSNLVISPRNAKPLFRGVFVGVQPHPVIARSKATKQSILALPPYGIASRSLSSARIRATRWLAMTKQGNPEVLLLERAFSRLSCGTSGLPIGARSVAGAWIVTSSLRTLDAGSSNAKSGPAIAAAVLRSCLRGRDRRPRA